MVIYELYIRRCRNVYGTGKILVWMSVTASGEGLNKLFSMEI